MAGPVAFNAIPGSKAAIPVPPPAASPAAPSAVAAPAAAAQSPEPAKAQEAPAPQQPRQRQHARGDSGQFLPSAAKADPVKSADAIATQRDAEERGVQDIQDFMDKVEARTETRAGSVQAEAKLDLSKAEEAAPEEKAEAEGEKKPEETKAGLDEAMQKRALDAGFKPEELAGLTKDEVDRQVVLRDRWIAEQGSKLASGETKPEAKPETVNAEVKPEVKAPVKDEFDADLGEEFDPTVREKFKEKLTKLDARNAARFAAQNEALKAQQAKLDEMSGFIRQQRVEKDVAETDAAFAKHKDALGETSIAKLDPKNPKDMLKNSAYQTAVGMVAYFKANGLAMPSDQEIVDRAVGVVVGMQPPKPKPATVTARSTSRQALRVPDSEKDALHDIDQFVKSKGGW